MKQLFKTKWLALALCLCAPLSSWADGDGENNEQSSATTIDLSELTENEELSTAGDYTITGDGSTNGYTITFPTGATGTYNLYFTGTVKIDTSTSSSEPSADSKRRAGAYFTEAGGENERADSCGIYIPGNTDLVVNMYIEGKVSIDADKYGIYVGENATLKILYVYADVSDGTDYIKDPTTYTLNIGDNSTLTYGIYNEGANLGIYTVNNTTGGTSDGNKNKTVFIGTTTITATDCGIYSYNGVDNEDTYLTINVTGDGDVTNNVTTSDSTPGYTINKLVCGIYVASRGDGNHGVNAAMMGLTITATGNCTYGIFLDGVNGSYADCYFGYGAVTITATQCVLHHEGQYNGYGKSGDHLVLTLNGPFCAHYMGTYDGSDGNGYSRHYWYCEGDLVSGDNTVYIIIDGIDMNQEYTGFNLNSDTSVGEVEYVGRKLYPGWNTVCLPYAYKININSNEEDDTYYDYTEARKVITAYAQYKETTTVNGESTITFEYIDTSDEDAALSSDTAYLMYVPDYTVDEDGNKTYKDFKTDFEQVQFTAMNTDLYVVKNRDNTTEVAFDPVFNAETMTGDQISGDESSHKHYKLTAHNKYQNNSTNEIVTDTEQSASATAGSAYTEGYTYVGIDNFFNKTSSETTFPAFRCYIDVDASSAAGQETKLATAFVESSISEDSEETTGINQLDGGTLNAIDGNAVVSVHGLNGQLVKTAAAKSATNGLAKGVYVVGGKKVVVM